MVLKCTCKSEFQDAKYGAGMRVHNPQKKEGYRCTVCGSPRGGPAKAEAKPVKAGGVKVAPAAVAAKK